MYALYLLDFFHDVFETIHGEQSTLEGLNKAFYQDFGQTICNAPTDVNQTWSHVKFTNQILENFIKVLREKEEKPFLNAIDGETPREDFNVLKSDFLAEKHEISKDWEEYCLHVDPEDYYKTALCSEELDNATHSNVVFYPKVLQEQIDAVLKEFGLTKEELYDLSLTDEYEQIKKCMEAADCDEKEKKEDFFVRHGVSPDTFSSLVTLVLGSDQTFAQTIVMQLKKRLWPHLKQVLKREMIKERYVEELGRRLREFQRYYRKLRKRKIREVFNKLIPANTRLSEQELEKYQTEASACVDGDTGLCPKKPNVVIQVPLLKMTEMFRYFASNFNIENVDTKISEVGTRIEDAYKKDANDLFEQIKTEGQTLVEEDVNNEAEKKASAYIASEEGLEKELYLLIEGVHNGELYQVNDDQKAKDELTAELNQRTNMRWLFSVSRAETGILVKIRRNLLITAIDEIRRLQNNKAKAFAASLTITKPQNQDEVEEIFYKNVAKLGNHLFLDLTVSEVHKTTPLSFSISRLQSFFQAVQLHEEGKPTFFATKLMKTFVPQENGSENSRNLYGNEIARKEMVSYLQMIAQRWTYLRSYGIWHAAISVSLHPEAFLFPELRSTKTPQFVSLLDQLEQDIPPDQVYSTFQEAITPFHELRLIDVVTTTEKVRPPKIPEFADIRLPPVREEDHTIEHQFVFAWHKKTNKFFYSVLTKAREAVRPTWSGWRLVPANFSWDDGKLENPQGKPPVQIIYHQSGENKYIHFLALGKMVTRSTEEVSEPEVGFPLLHLSLQVKGSSLGSTSTAESEDPNEGDQEVSWEAISDDEEQLAAVYVQQRVGSQPLTSADVACFGYSEGLRRVLNYCERVVDLTEKYRELATGLGLKWFALESDGIVSENAETGLFQPGSKILTAILILNSFSDEPMLVFRNLALFEGGISVLNIPQELSTVHSRNVNTELSTPNTVRFLNTIESLKSGYLHGRTASLPLWNTQIPDGRRFVEVSGIRYETAEGFNNWVWDDNQGGAKDRQAFPILHERSLLVKNQLHDLVGTYTTTKDGSQDHFLIDPKGPGESKPISVLYRPLLGTPNKYFLEELTIQDAFLPSASNKLSLPATVADDAWVYWDELYLHAPLAIANYLTEQGKYKEADLWLEQASQYIQKEQANSELITSRAIGIWLDEPFNPFALAELSRDVYAKHVELTKITNLVEWADHQFVLDSSESVNRSRELYERAQHGIRTVYDPEKEISESTNASSAQCLQAHGIALVGDTPYQAGQGSGNTAQTLKSSNDFTSTFDKRWSACMNDAEEDLIVSSLESEDPFEGVDQVDILGPLPEIIEGPSLSENPQISLLRWKIEAGLEKIRNNQNFAGYPRQLQPYATPVDPEKLVRLAASGIFEFEQFIPNTPPPLYRYSFLVERAKYLVSVAQQLQGSMLATLEKKDAESYTLLKARQDSQLAKKQVVLQSLRMKEAKHGIKQAESQLDRMEFQRDHYSNLITKGISRLERSAIYLNAAASGSFVTAAAFGKADVTTPTSMVFTSIGHALSGTAQALATKAYWNRREQDWKFQRDVANFDSKIAEIGINIAEDRFDIVEKEKEIAQLSLEQAKDTLEFLGNKFTNRNLYKWMTKRLRKFYRQQLNMAISTAKAAQVALEFERQSSLDYIGYDYWDQERKGLLGSEHLLKDIEEMEDYRLQSARRKREIEKTLSLATLFPLEFQQFKQDGVLEFATLKTWFDQDFPGHYLRLIRDVRVSLRASVPPNEGIHATLSKDSISHVMAGPPFEETTKILKQPEAIALDRANEANGLFELQPNDSMLFPFEGTGVDSTWRFEMPKGANKIDYDTIADVLFTIRYTALEDRTYRTKLLDELWQRDENGFVNAGSVRVVSARNEFPDQWYYFRSDPLQKAKKKASALQGLRCEDFGKNGVPKDKDLPPYSMVLPLSPNDFLPNEENRRISSITAVMQVDRSDHELDEELSLPVSMKFFPRSCLLGSANALNLELSPSQTINNMNVMAPYGYWLIKLDWEESDAKHPLIYPEKLSSGTTNASPKTPNLWKVQDLVLAIEYTAQVHYPD